MTVSVIIVNYNVKHYLDQCLASVFASTLDEHLEGIEVIVADNNSDDGSVEMLRAKYPQVEVIANHENLGFAKANNQAIRRSHGDLVLLLNPDTMVERDTLRICAAHFADNPQCGGVTVKMINGEGEFLRESKRGFPTPAASFYKLSGLIRLMPRHPKVAAYYMGNLPDNQDAAIDILPGAFLMISRQALDKVGLLDESYFMFGEDIDFSWRIRLAGFENHYLANTRILHYKGESTRRSNINYIYTFYNAMSIFAKRYYGGKNTRLFLLLIQVAIWGKAFLQWLGRVTRRLCMPVLDFLVTWGGFAVAKSLWTSWKTGTADYYPDYYTWMVMPLYSLLFIVAMYLCGGYDKPLRTGRSLRGIAVGAMLLLLFYSLLDESLRFSRAILLLGSALAAVTTSALRYATTNVLRSSQPSHRRQHYVIAASSKGYERIMALLDQLGIHPSAIDALAPQQVRLYKPKPYRQHEVIVFSQEETEVADMLDCMAANSGQGTLFRTAPKDNPVLIGPDYTHTADDIYITNTTPLPSPTARRSKRLFDIATALVLLLLSPLLFWPQRRKRRYFADCIQVLSGRLTWVGYTMPNVRAGVFRTRDRYPNIRQIDSSRLDTAYAADYHTTTDLMIILTNWNRI
ncbi:MAG: glycosyltransferase [Bacteroidales bacterium]|nr:glycosyltransferase [Bacteroidales bacterium]